MRKFIVKTKKIRNRTWRGFKGGGRGIPNNSEENDNSPAEKKKVQFNDIPQVEVFKEEYNEKLIKSMDKVEKTLRGMEYPAIEKLIRTISDNWPHNLINFLNTINQKNYKADGKSPVKNNWFTNRLMGKKQAPRINTYDWKWEDTPIDALKKKTEDDKRDAPRNWEMYSEDNALDIINDLLIAGVESGDIIEHDSGGGRSRRSKSKKSRRKSRKSRKKSRAKRRRTRR
jgi:hypothetical protein